MPSAPPEQAATPTVAPPSRSRRVSPRSSGSPGAEHDDQAVVHPAEPLQLPGQGGGDPGDLLVGPDICDRLGDRDRQVGVEVGALLASPFAQPVGVEVPPADEVGQQLAAHPALGLGLGTTEEQHQRRDECPALQRSPLGQVHAAGWYAARACRGAPPPRRPRRPSHRRRSARTDPRSWRGRSRLRRLVLVGRRLRWRPGEQAALVVVHREPAAEHLAPARRRPRPRRRRGAARR